MRKTSVCILTLALMGGTAAMAMAQAAGTSTSTGATTTTTTTTTKKPVTSHCKAAHGSVASKDDTAKSFTVHPKAGADMTFMTNDKTSYWHGKKKATWADLATGDNVHVTCMMDGTNMVAKTVKMSTPKAASTDSGMKH